jgi:hypothetical protein
MSISAKSVLTVIAITVVGATSAIADILNDRLRKVAKPMIRSGGTALGGYVGGPVGAWVGYNAADYALQLPPPGQPYYSQQGQQVPPNQDQYPQQYPQYVSDGSGYAYRDTYAAPPLYSNICLTYAGGWDYVRAAPVGSPCTVVAYGYGGVPSLAQGQIIQP